MHPLHSEKRLRSMNSTRHHAAIVFSITIYRNAAANATMIKSFPGLRNTRILILSILATFFVLPVWSATTLLYPVYFNSHSVLVKLPVLISPSPLKKPTILFRTDKFAVELVLYATDPRNVTFPSCVTLSVPMRL